MKIQNWWQHLLKCWKYCSTLVLQPKIKNEREFKPWMKVPASLQIAFCLHFGFVIHHTETLPARIRLGRPHTWMSQYFGSHLRGLVFKYLSSNKHWGRKISCPDHLGANPFPQHWAGRWCEYSSIQNVFSRYSDFFSQLSITFGWKIFDPTMLSCIYLEK